MRNEEGNIGPENGDFGHESHLMALINRWQKGFKNPSLRQFDFLDFEPQEARLVVMEILNFNSTQEIEWYLNPTWK